MSTSKLGELSHIFTKGTTPTTLGLKLNQGSISFIKVECLGEDGQIITEKVQKIDEDTHLKLKRSQLEVGDILFSIAGSIGRMAVVTEDLVPANTNQAVALLRPNTGLVDTDYLYYFLRDRKSQRDAQRRIVQSVQNNLSLGELSDLDVVLPPRSIQKSIASIVKTLEKKIICNSEISKNLESIVQTIFKSWFIDFDPVKAKMVGEKPVGMDDATAILFPKSMKDSELGPIPDNWTASQIGEEVECVGGSTPSTSNSEFWDGDIYWTTPKDLSKQVGLVTTSSERKITMKGLQKISSGVLPVNSVLMSSRAPIGYLSINAVPTAINQGFIALRHSSKFSPLFLLYWLQRNMPEIKNRAGGGTFAEISRTAFKSIPFVVPTTDVLNKFEEISTPILLQLTALTMQNQELVELRDSLLPRLISGELQIPEDMLVS